MKFARTTIAKALALTAVCLASNLAFAAGSSTLAVTAGVIGTCKFAATSTPLAFSSTIDPSSTTNVTATANVLYQCTKNTASVGITGTTGAHSMNTTPTANATPLAYTMAISGDTSAGNGFGPGTSLTAVVTGTITPAQFQNVIAGSYSDNVTMSITP